MQKRDWFAESNGNIPHFSISRKICKYDLMIICGHEKEGGKEGKVENARFSVEEPAHGLKTMNE